MTYVIKMKLRTRWRRPEIIKSVTFDEITAGATRRVGTKIDLTQLTGEPMRAKNTAD